MEVHLQKPITVAMVLAVIGCVGCVPVSDNGLSGTGGQTVMDVNTYPLVERAGRLTATELIGLFKGICLENFADSPAMRAAFVRHGFTVRTSDMGVGEEFNELFLLTGHASKGIVGSFGQYVILDAGLYDNCSLEAYVTEADTINKRDVVSTLVFGKEVRPGPGYANVDWRTADGRIAEITVEEPSIETMGTADGGVVRERQKLKISISARIEP